MVVEDPKRWAELHVDGGGLHHLRIPRVDPDATGLDQATNGPVGQCSRVGHRPKFRSVSGRHVAASSGASRASSAGRGRAPTMRPPSRPPLIATINGMDWAPTGAPRPGFASTSTLTTL